MVFGSVILAILAGRWLMPLGEESAGTSETPLGAGIDPSSSGTSPAPTQGRSAEANLSPAVRAKFSILTEIFNSRNDNDPRLDRELRVLDPETREAFRAHYHALPKESLNQRGTIVFLLGRNLTTPTDVEFLGNVLSEQPCLSLVNCFRDAEEPRGEEAHLDSANEVTLVYPQLVSLRALESLLASDAGKDPALLESARHALKQAENSRSARVAEQARRLNQRFFR